MITGLLRIEFLYEDISSNTQHPLYPVIYSPEIVPVARHVDPCLFGLQHVLARLSVYIYYFPNFCTYVAKRGCWNMLKDSFEEYRCLGESHYPAFRGKVVSVGRVPPPDPRLATA